jgi:hypothetical protein
VGTKLMIPPTFWCGWLLDIDSIFDVVKTICPDAIRYIGLIHDPKRRQVDKRATVLSETLSKPLARCIELDEKFASLLRGVRVAHSDGEIGIALTVGSNHSGILGQEHVDKLSELFVDGEPPKWHIDPYEWQWEIVRGAYDHIGCSSILIKLCYY